MRKLKNRIRTVVSFRKRTLLFNLISFDPGSNKVGVAKFSVFILSDEVIFTVVSCVQLKLKGKSVYSRLHQLNTFLIESNGKYDLGIIEMTFVKKSWKTSLILANAKGVIMSYLGGCTNFQYEISNQYVKGLFLEKDRNDNSKSRIQEILRERFDLITESTDVSDALSMGLAYIVDKVIVLDFGLADSENLRIFYVDQLNSLGSSVQ